MMPRREGPPMERRGSRLSRRQFAVGAGALGLLAGCGRLPGQGQPAPVAPCISPLSSSSPSDTGTWANHKAFRQGLRERGYVEAGNIAIASRFAPGREERLPDLVLELTSLPVDVLVCPFTRPGRARWRSESPPAASDGSSRARLSGRALAPSPPPPRRGRRYARTCSRIGRYPRVGARFICPGHADTATRQSSSACSST